MEELKKVVEDYITTEQADYAILIKGPWGSGKTHFFKNQLSPLIVKHSFKPLYISLYGLSKLEDLSKTLVLALFPQVLQTKPMKKLISGAGVVSSALSAISMAGFSLDPNKMINNLFSKWVSVGKDNILCFYDLERARLDVGQVLGFINNLVEHDNIKTILIANEDEIIKNQQRENYPEKVQAALQALSMYGQDKEIRDEELSHKIDDLFKSSISYPTIKEKLVGRTVEYKPDIESILDSIIAIYESDTELMSFLVSNKQVIIKTFERSDKCNIRALKGALDMYRVVHKTIKSAGNTSLKNHLLGLLVFTIAVSLEIRTDESQISEFKGMNSRFDYHFASLLRKDEKPYLKTFYDKYFSEGAPESDFSKTIVQYVTDGFFSKAQFLAEFSDEQETLDPIKKKLSSIFSYYELDSKEFKKISYDVLKYAAQGKIDIPNYTRLFEYYEYFSQSGLIKETSDNIKKKFLHGIETAFRKTTYDKIKDFSWNEFPTTGERTPAYLEVKKSLDAHAEKLREADRAKICSQLLDLLPDRFEDFMVMYYDQSYEFANVPIFKYYPVRKLLSRIERLRTQDIRRFAHMLDKRYTNLNFAPDLRKDYDNINALRVRTEKLSGKVKRKTLRLHWFEQLATILGKICNRLEPVGASNHKDQNTIGA